MRIIKNNEKGVVLNLLIDMLNTFTDIVILAVILCICWQLYHL